MKSILIIICTTILLASCSNSKCIKSHKETIYSTQWTSLWLATKNPWYLWLNWPREVEVCDLYEELK